MISQELLDLLRCPMDPRRAARLVEESDKLVCDCCRLRYNIKDGFPVLIVEEAELPSGCSSLDQLPCQVAAATSPAAQPKR